ncbi:hypothetical protein CRUP_031281, partial [Coryphaenoides rupestris]
VYIRIHDNEWNVYRRYTEFRELHNHLRTKFPSVQREELCNSGSDRSAQGRCSQSEHLAAVALSMTIPRLSQGHDRDKGLVVPAGVCSDP